jgi:segregation and condensation protein B
MTLTPEQLQRILEAAIMVAGRPLTLADLQKLFDESEDVSTQAIQEAIQAIQQRHVDSGIELTEVASGFQFQARMEYSQWLSRLWEERAPRFSRALLETIALIAYRQPITRAEIEEIRGVSVSTHIVKTLQDREWIRVIGYRDVPGKPALYATTKTFLDHLNLKSLEDLPTLSELKDLESQEEKLQVQLELAAHHESENTEAASEPETLENTDTTPELADTAEDSANQATEETENEASEAASDETEYETTEAEESLSDFETTETETAEESDFDITVEASTQDEEPTPEEEPTSVEFSGNE